MGWHHSVSLAVYTRPSQLSLFTDINNEIEAKIGCKRLKKVASINPVVI